MVREQQRTPVYVYKWEDVQIQHGIGDIHIDMTKAANIKETNTIVVRHILGKVQVIVPLNYNNINLRCIWYCLFRTTIIQN